MQKKQKKLLRAVVPLLVVLAVAALWAWKNRGHTAEPAVTDNPDFALKAGADLDLEVLKAYGLPIVLDFSADWCQPCREMEPILAKLHAELAGKAIIKIVDTEALPAFTANYPVRVIPTQFFYDREGNPFSPGAEMSADLILYGDTATEEHLLTAHEGLLYESMLREILTAMGVENAA